MRELIIKNKVLLFGVSVLGILASNSFVFQSYTANAAAEAQWTHVSSPELSNSQGGSLSHIACPSVDSCHAVGIIIDQNGIVHSLMQKYDGTTWSVVASSDPVGSEYVILNDIDCVSATFCQAVGSYHSGGMDEHALIYSYNGTTWSVATSTGPAGSQSLVLNGVDCVSTTFCQAVGSYVDNGSHQHALIYTYNGTTWTVATSPDPVGAVGGGLTSVACVSTTFCQAGGHYFDSSNHVYTQLLGYNGTSWSVATSPDPISDAVNGGLSAIVCLSTTFCQAVGFYRAPDFSWHSIAKTYNGTTWSTATVSGPGNVGGELLRDVDCVSATFCQAVGSYFVSNIQKPLVHTYNGTTWSVTAVPEPSDFANGNLEAVSCTSATACQTVGIYQDTNNDQRALIQSYNGADWSVVGGLDPEGAVYALLLGIDCASTTFCQAVGGYGVSGGSGSVLIETYASIPVPPPPPVVVKTPEVLSPTVSYTAPRRSSSYSEADSEANNLVTTAAEPTLRSLSPGTDTSLKPSQDTTANEDVTVTTKPRYSWLLLPIIIVSGIVLLVAISIKIYRLRRTQA